MANDVAARSRRQWKYAPDSRGLYALLSERERFGNGHAIHGSLQGHGAFMRRLAVDATLKGHEGCVNHLRWNRQGTLLASGSDDTKLILWDYATKKPREVIESGHRLNIFAVCFVPETNDHIIATGAMDKEVRVHYAPFRREATKRFRFHTGRVKDIASSPGVPKVFWSVAEDGLVYQFDVRALPRSDGTGTADEEASGVLIRLGKTRSGAILRGMAMAAHPLDPTKVVVACGDFYTRMYDRRMLRTQAFTPRRHGSSDANITVAMTSPEATVPVEIFAPPHLHMDAGCDTSTKRRHDDSHSTSIQFSSDGAEILANYHNDHIYLFRVHHREHSSGEDLMTPVAVYDKSGGHEKPQHSARIMDWMLGMDVDVDTSAAASRRTRNDLQTLHSRGLVMLVSKNYVGALELFLQVCGARRQLQSMSDSFRKDVYHNTAKAYLGRAWRADDYLASQYAKLAESLDPNDHSVQLTLIRALQAGRRSRHLIVRANHYQSKFPSRHDDVETMLSDAVSRQSSRRDRQLRVFRRSGFSSSNESDSGDDDGEATTENDEHGDDDAEEEDSDGDDDEMDGEDSSDSSDGELHIEEEPVQSEPEDHEDVSDTSDESGDSRYWKGMPNQGVRVNCDVSKRFVGYCNLQTDIKEANFFGPNDECIVAGSDDGKAYIWHKKTGKLLNAIDADADILNCVQPHPYDVCLATSGIENVVRLWKPTGDVFNSPTDDELEEFVESNQKSMADSGSYYLHGANPNIIRLIFQSADQEGVQECATS